MWFNVLFLVLIVMIPITARHWFRPLTGRQVFSVCILLLLLVLFVGGAIMASN
jgi:hypothetical protein